jgi:hypothetical protein
MIEGKVAKVISEYEVVVNQGYSDGIEEDMEFVVYTVGDSIVDPDTGEDLGNFEHVKAKIEPEHIQEHMTIMETAETKVKKSNVGVVSSLYQSERVPKKIAERPDDAVESAVKVGDLVRENIS